MQGIMRAALILGVCGLGSLVVANTTAASAVSEMTVTYPISYEVDPPVSSQVPGQPVAKQMVTASIPATLFFPEGSERLPAVVFVHDGKNGVSPGVKRRCQDIAAQGFVVLAPEYKGDGLGMAVASDLALHSIVQAQDFLNKHPRVKQNTIGLVGTSQGGYLALQAAIHDAGNWDCVVQSSGAIDVPSSSTRIQSRVLLQHGDKDRRVLRKHANHLDATLRRAGTSCELKEYTLLAHNFWFWEDKDLSVEELAQAEWAWDDVINFLNRSMNSPASYGMTN